MIGVDIENDYYDVNLKVARRAVLENFCPIRSQIMTKKRRAFLKALMVILVILTPFALICERGFYYFQIVRILSLPISK